MAVLSPAAVVGQAARSVDGSDTLDLSRQRIDAVDPAAVVALAAAGRQRTGVRRLALSHNALTTLPSNFHLLTRLRYLNLKGNELRALPHELTLLPSLEILDLSRNKLAALPPSAGTLVRLRVLSLSQNRLADLPPWFGEMRELRVFKVDGNGWAADVRAVLLDGHDGKDEKDWIDGVRRWVRARADDALDLALDPPPSTARAGDRPSQQARTTPPPPSSQPSTPSAFPSSSDAGTPTTTTTTTPTPTPTATGPSHARRLPSTSSFSTFSAGDLRTPGAHAGAESGGSARGHRRGHSTASSAGGAGFAASVGPATGDAALPSTTTTAGAFEHAAPARAHRRVESASSVGSRNGVADFGSLLGAAARGGGQHRRGESGGEGRFAPREGFAVREEEAASPPVTDLSPRPSEHNMVHPATEQVQRAPSDAGSSIPTAPDSLAAFPLPPAADPVPPVSPSPSDSDSDDRSTPFAQFSHFSLSAPSPTKPFPTAAPFGPDVLAQAPEDRPGSHALRGSATLPPPPPALGGAHLANLYAVSPRQRSTDGLSSARGSIASAGGGHARHHSHSTFFAPPPAGPHAGGGAGRVDHAPFGPRLGSKASSGSIHRLAFPHGAGAGVGRQAGGLKGADGRVGGAGDDASGPGGNGGGPPTQLIEGSRDSYFRRLSTLPASTIPASMPPALLTLIDGARGLLFALAQIQATLRRHPTSPLDDRFAGVLARVLEPAAHATDGLINALDRFDSTSRRASSPPARVVRGVVEALKANVGAYGKVIAVLIIQLKVSSAKIVGPQPPAGGHPSLVAQHHPHAAKENFEDIRFTRTLLCHLYGALGEVSHAWRAMVPVLPDVAPLLRDPNVPPRYPLAMPSSSLPAAAGGSSISSGASQAGGGGVGGGVGGGRQQRLLSTASSARAPMSPVPERLEGLSISTSAGTPGTLDGLSPGTVPALGGNPAPLGVAPSPPPAAGHHHHRSHSRTHSQKVQLEAQARREAAALARERERERLVRERAEDERLRREMELERAAEPPREDGDGPGSPEQPDDLAGQLLEEAVQTAFAVWNLMEHDLTWASSAPESSPSRSSVVPQLPKPITDLLSLIALAKTHTRALHDTMRLVPAADDEGTLVEQATAFFQSVRKVAGMTRVVFEREGREFRRDLKVGLGKLTRLTMESATLLHVSNLKRPGTSMSSYTAYAPDESYSTTPYPPPTPTLMHPYAPSSVGTGMRPLALGRSRSAMGDALATPPSAHAGGGGRVGIGASAEGFRLGHGGRSGGRSIGTAQEFGGRSTDAGGGY